MANTSAKKAPAKEDVPKLETPPNSAMKWQMGGLIAGIIVAIISTTEPGLQVGRPCVLRSIPVVAPCVAEAGDAEGRSDMSPCQLIM